MRHKSPELNLIHNIEINERINEKNMNINNNDKRNNYEQNKGNNINDDNLTQFVLLTLNSIFHCILKE